MLEKREALLQKKMAEEIRKAKEYTKMKNKRGKLRRRCDATSARKRACPCSL